MELRHLRYFVAVAEELHFRRASERLHIAQPAVSQQIRALETELGVELFRRAPRSVTLTPAGSAMLVEARRVLSQADGAQRAARQAQAGPLRVGYLPDAVPETLTRLLRRFSALPARTAVTLEPGAARRLLEDVRGDRLDVAVVCLPAPVAELQRVPIGQEGIVAAVPVGHPCAAGGELRLSDLGPTRLVHLARTINPAFHDGMLAACRDAGIVPSLVEIAAPAVEQVLLSVACGAGIALLPASTETRFATAGVRFVAVADPAPACDVVLVARSPASTATTALLELAARTYRPGRRLLVAA